jgi:predicted dinucleotide-binding enzyme
MKIGVIGAGNIGRALARTAVAGVHQVMLANSRGPGSLKEVAASLHCEAGTVAQAAAFGDVVIVAIPLRAIDQLEPEDFKGKIVLDANNYYPARDGAIEVLDAHQGTTSGLLQRRLSSARVVKFFNAILQDDIQAHAKTAGAPDRRALPIAGDDPEAKRIAAKLVDEFGFDPVDAGSLEESWRFERAMPAYCVPLDAAHLSAALASARRGVELPNGSWRAKRPLNGAPPPRQPR